MEPTEANFFAALQDLTSRGCDIDTWMFSHGSPDWQAQSDLSVISVGGSITAMDDDEHLADSKVSPDIITSELAADSDPANSGTPAVPVRMTYGTPCFYKEWNQTWIDLGAKVTAGAGDINFVPTYFRNFATAWDGGQNYGASLAGERTVAAEAVAFGFIAAEGALPPCLCATVLDKKPCSAAFFSDIDLKPLVDVNGKFIDGPDEAKYAIGGPLWDMAGIAYNTSVSGTVNMRSSSAKTLVGNAGIRKNVPATLTWP